MNNEQKFLDALKAQGFTVRVPKQRRPGTWMEHEVTFPKNEPVKKLRAAMKAAGWKAGRNMMPAADGTFYFQKGTRLVGCIDATGRIEFQGP